MGYYCTVPQCTSLAGKTKNVKFHRFPRDHVMADKWNNILKRGKPVTRYSKVCSLHFTQADYNVTTMGQWKTLSKEAIPTQNLPKLNPDGSVMVIRKTRTIKYKEQKKDESTGEKHGKWSPVMALNTTQDRLAPTNMESQDSALSYRLQKLNDLASIIAPHSAQPSPPEPPRKQDAIMQTDPVQPDDEEPQAGYSSSEKSRSPDAEYRGPCDDQEYDKDQYEKEPPYKKDEDYPEDAQYAEDRKEPTYQKDQQSFPKDEYGQKFEAKDYTKTADDYIPQTNEEYNKEAEKYALERKSHNGYEKGIEYQKQLPLENGYQKLQDLYAFTDKPPEYEPRPDYAPAPYQPYGAPPRHDLHLLQEQHRINENQNFFNENHIKQEVDFGNEEDKFLYERNKDQLNKYDEAEYSRAAMEQRLLQQMQLPVKQEPDAPSGCESVMQPQTSPYYNTNGHTNVTGGYYDQLSQISRPGPELLIAKQNALAAHTQLWQNTKRPFFYSSSTHYNAPQLIHRYEDLTRIQQ